MLIPITEKNAEFIYRILRVCEMDDIFLENYLLKQLNEINKEDNNFLKT